MPCRKLQYQDSEEGETAYVEKFGPGWRNIVMPLLSQEPEDELLIVIWVRLAGENELVLESWNAPSALSHVLRMGEDGRPCLRALERLDTPNTGADRPS